MKQQVCHLSELTPFQGCGAWIGDQQAELFYLPGDEPHVYALQNWDPIGKAYVMARGIVGDVKGEPCVASPLYKQHFSLLTGSVWKNRMWRLRPGVCWWKRGRCTCC